MPLVTDITRSAVIREIAGALEVTRTFRVSGLLGNPYDILFNAMSFPGVPNIGDAYPGGRDAFRVREKNGRPDANGADVLVVVTYSDKTGPTWNQATPNPGDVGEDVKQISTGLQQYETTVDIDGIPMLINPPPSEGAKTPYLSTAVVSVPAGQIVFERTETEPPAVQIRNQVGETNEFQVGLYPAGSLLFTRIDATSLDGGRVWRVVYEFSYSSRGWVHRDRYTRADGKVPTDATEQIFTSLPRFDYAVLNLDWSDNQTPLP